MISRTSYTILKDLKLIIEFYNNDICIDDIIALKKVLFLDKDYQPDFNILMDLTDATLESGLEGVLKYIDFAKKNISYINKRKVAFYTSKPSEVVSGVLFSESNKDLPIDLKVFSTIDAVFKFLNFSNNMEESKINKALLELKNSSTK